MEKIKLILVDDHQLVRTGIANLLSGEPGFEIIGEASRNIERVAPDFLARHPELPLSFAYDMRNVLAHGYYKVDLRVVWRTIERDLPYLKEQVALAMASVG